MRTLHGQRGRELKLINGSIAATGAQDWFGIPTHWGKNPRLQALVSDFAGTGNITIDIEHFLVSPSAVSKLGQMIISADGTYELYAENLSTRFPFPMVRANVISVDSGVSGTIVLVLTGDKQT